MSTKSFRFNNDDDVKLKDLRIRLKMELSSDIEVIRYALTHTFLCPECTAPSITDIKDLRKDEKKEEIKPPVKVPKFKPDIIENWLFKVEKVKDGAFPVGTCLKHECTIYTCDCKLDTIEDLRKWANEQFI